MEIIDLQLIEGSILKVLCFNFQVNAKSELNLQDQDFQFSLLIQYTVILMQNIPKDGRFLEVERGSAC